MAGGGILKSFLLLFSLLGWVDAKGQTYQILNMVGDAPLYFLPLLVAVTTANKLKVNPLVALSAVGALLLPNMTAMLTEGAQLMSFDVKNIAYAYQVFPAILSVLLYAQMEKFFTRFSPKPIRIFFVPMMSLVITVPVTLLLLGPLGFTAGQGFSIDPNEYQVVQDKSFASFNHMNTDILLFASLLFAALCLYIWTFRAKLDVMSLGKEQAVNLGIDYDGITKKMLIVIAILVSIATALVGPITFLGLLVVNVARELFRTYRHTYLLLGSFFISDIALVGGEFLVEKVFTFQTPLSVLIDLVGGLYFIYLLLKESRSWS
ncbi:iron chelate uptake ABC transporter family permease subunit [Escherichia coli]|nr:iron chelate uptake ABC transporter family permease subunit [Escherichia coli]